MINFDQLTWETKLRRLASEKGKLAPVRCKDYFVFLKLLYSEIPSLAVGRGHWDSWMIHYAYKLGIPVIDATEMVTAIHQNHDYAHLLGGRCASLSYSLSCFSLRIYLTSSDLQ